jgi:hypothetical protein
MDDRVISAEGVEIAEAFLYIELLRAYSDGIYTTAVPETCRYEKSYKLLLINVKKRLLASSRLSVHLSSRIRADPKDIFS